MLSYFISFIGPTGSGLTIFLFSFPLTLLFTHLVLRKSIKTIPQKVGIYLFFLFLTVAIGLVFFPFPDLTPSFCETHKTATQWQLHPFRFISDIQNFSVSEHLFGIQAILYNKPLFQVIFNVLLILPLGFLGVIVFRWSFLKTLIFGSITTLLFELLQGTALFGILKCPYRLFDVDDLMLNLTGALIGRFIAYQSKKLIHHWINFKRNKIKKENYFIRRLLAFGTDISIIYAVILLFEMQIPSLQSLVNLFETFTFLFIYFVLISSLFHGRTLGKYLFGLKIVSEKGEKPSTTQLFLRSIITIFSLPILSLFSLIIAIFTGVLIFTNFTTILIYLTIIFIIIPLNIELSKKGRGLHDYLANTKVETRETGLYRLYLSFFEK